MKVLAAAFFGLLLSLYMPASAMSAAPPDFVIVRSQKAGYCERLAAKEVRRYLYLRTGTVVHIKSKQTMPDVDSILICSKDRKLLSLTVNSREKLKKTLNSLQPQEYQIRSISYNGRRTLVICGGDGVGTLYGSYRFAEHLGVRFYLHGDTIPDVQLPLKLPEINDSARPLFRLRGILPFHDFPEGPDWWNKDDYKAIIGQMPKLRMNFIGFHTYPETNVGPEPTVWIGIPEDVTEEGTVKFSSNASYHNTLRGNIGYAAKHTGEFNFGAAKIFERDAYGSELMFDMMPRSDTTKDNNKLFNRVGNLFKDAFGYGQRLGVKFCMGTETPLCIPRLVQKRMKKKGFDTATKQGVQKAYEGIFTRIKKLHPLDYYWFWTPETWLHKVSDKQVKNTRQNILTAIAAAKKINAPFTLATCGWVLGPPENPAQFDEVLPKEMPFSCINQSVGREPVDEYFAHIKKRPKWAIPWLEDDPAQTSPQLWVGRMRKDAYDAYRYGCTGLMGIHWRTRILGPNVSALAKAAWHIGRWAKNQNSIANKRYLPADDFYQDWAVHQFGTEPGKKIAAVFTRIDGKLPRPSNWIQGPGGILKNKKPWSQVKKQYWFVEKLQEIEEHVKGRGNRERFSYWLDNFRFMKEMARVGCTIGTLDLVMEKINKQKSAAARKTIAEQKAIPLRKQLLEQWGRMQTFLLQTVSSPGAMGTVANIEQHSMRKLHLLNKHDRKLRQIIGKSLNAAPWKEYRGRPGLIVPTVRANLEAEEDLKLKVIILTSKPHRHVQLYWRRMGKGFYKKEAVSNVKRGVYSATLQKKQIDGRDFEYYLKLTCADGQEIYFPATAPDINQTVVVQKP